MKAQELSFRTYKTCTSRWDGDDRTLPSLNARLERERAMRYIDQANTAMRLAKEALSRAAGHEERASTDWWHKDKRDWRDVADVAELCGVSKGTVYKWIDKAPPGAVKTSLRHTRYLVNLSWLRHVGKLK